MAVSPERVAEIVALLEQALGLPPKLKPKPKVVTSEAKVVRDADVLVSKSDPNYPGSDEGKIPKVWLFAPACVMTDYGFDCPNSTWRYYRRPRHCVIGDRLLCVE
jgi:hypothetical protein